MRIRSDNSGWKLRHNRPPSLGRASSDTRDSLPARSELQEAIARHSFQQAWNADLSMPQKKTLSELRSFVSRAHPEHRHNHLGRESPGLGQ